MADESERRSVLETLTSLPESAKSVVLAFSVIVDRIRTLPAADQNDLLVLATELPKCDNDEERSGIYQAMEEILAQVPIRVHSLAFAEDGKMSSGLKAWTGQVGWKIKELRLAAHMNQSELAEKAGLTQSHVSRLERAEHSPTHFTLEKIAKALGIEVGEIDPAFD